MRRFSSLPNPLLTRCIQIHHVISHVTRSRLLDPDLPGVAALATEDTPAPLTTAYSTVGTTIDDAAVVSITWWPGSRLSIQYRIDGSHGDLPGTSHAVIVTGGAPSGSFVVEDDETSLGVWILPNDPALPGLRSALDLVAVNELLAGLGAAEKATSTRLRAYRPARRAVVEVRAGGSSVYLKVVPPVEVDVLHANHRHLAHSLPVPDSLGVSRELGIVAMRALPGNDLRSVMRRGGDMPPWTDIPPLLAALPAPRSKRHVRSHFRSIPRLVDLLGRLVPDRRPQLENLAERLGDETLEASVPSHGDFHEAQIMVSGRHVVGLVDVDTFGWGRTGDDPATMLAHLDLLAAESPHPRRIREYALALNRHWDVTLDPADLRRRVSAVILGLAVGPFRVQRERWPEEVAGRIDAASRWAESADRVHERSPPPPQDSLTVVSEDDDIGNQEKEKLMQTREQVRNWKVIGSLATVAALGVTGLAVANAAPSDTPPPIELEDKRTLDTTITTTTEPGFVIVPGQSVTMDDSLDSPLASSDLDSLDSDDGAAPATTRADDSPASADTADSPASPVSVDSPASASADSADSLDS